MRPARGPLWTSSTQVICGDSNPRTGTAIPPGTPANARGYALNFTAIPNGNPMPFLTAYPTGQAQYYCVSGKVNNADKLYLVIESVKRDTKHTRSSIPHAPVDGAEDSTML